MNSPIVIRKLVLLTTRLIMILAFGLLQASLSAKGLQLSKDIKKTDHTLKELNNGSDDYDEEYYFFTVMGQPSASEPWGWQLDGHHPVIKKTGCCI